MNVAVDNHTALQPDGDEYQPPELVGYPEVGDSVEVEYRSYRTGKLMTRSGTIEEVNDRGRRVGDIAPVADLEVVVDDGGEGRLCVWCGGGYAKVDAAKDGFAPAQVYNEYRQKNEFGHEWRTTILGALVSLRAPEGVTFEVTVTGVPTRRLNGIERNIIAGVRQRFKHDEAGGGLLEVDVNRVDGEEVPDHE